MQIREAQYEAAGRFFLTQERKEAQVDDASRGLPKNRPMITA